MSVAGLPTIVQHVNHLAARVQAIVFRIDALSEEIGELRQNVGGGREAPPSSPTTSPPFARTSSATSSASAP